MRLINRTRWPLVLLLGAALSGCLGGGDDGGQDAADTGGTALAVQGNTQGRLLASNCFQCHGTNGSGGFDRLLGKGDLLAELREYVSTPEGSDIMAAHAQGYTDAQLQAIASYLANP